MEAVVFSPELQTDLPQASTSEKILQNFEYTSCYCEENVYMLCKTLSQQGLAALDLSDLFVIFISNPIRQIPIWRQKSSKDTTGLVVWDYHVICIQKDLTKREFAQVWDLDTTLPCPTSLELYFTEAIQPWMILNSKYHRLYRVVAAPMFLRWFASDRRHMKTLDGNWLATPPLYDCLVAEDGNVHNLEDFIKMSTEQVSPNLGEVKVSLLHQKHGVVLTEEGLKQFFT